MYDDVDIDATAQLIADVLLREGATWFKKLRPVDASGKLRLPVQHDSEHFRGPFLGGASISLAGSLAPIMEVRRQIYADMAPRLLSSMEAFCKELQALPTDAPVAHTTVCLGQAGLQVTVYVDMNGARLIGLLAPEGFVLE